MRSYVKTRSGREEIDAHRIERAELPDLRWITIKRRRKSIQMAVEYICLDTETSHYGLDCAWIYQWAMRIADTYIYGRTAPEIIRALYDGFMAGTADIRAAGAELMESAKAAIMEKVEAAKDWGRDLIQNFIDGIFSKWEDLKNSVRDVAQTVKDFLGFSEPTVGPLSDFHTYAPDMMDLWNEGIRSKEAEMRRQLASSFDLRPTIERAGGVQEAAAPRAPEPADNAAVLALLERNVRLLERIESEFSGLRVKGRMA